MRRFAIVSHSRSGSNLLVRSLHAHADALCFGELLKPGDPAATLASLEPTPADIELLRHTHRSDTADFAQAFYALAMRQGAAAAGFKIFYYHARERGREQIWSLLVDDPELRIIHLTRPNTFDAYLSRALATATGTWLQVAKRQESIDYDAKVTIDSADFWEFHQNLTAQVEKATRTLPDDALHLTYEDMADRYAETMARLCDHLGLARFVPDQPLQRQRHGHRWDYVENAEATRAFLAARGLEAMI
jgi:LPS sulfotransferase NodH